MDTHEDHDIRTVRLQHALQVGEATTEREALPEARMLAVVAVAPDRPGYHVSRTSAITKTHSASDPSAA
jgi:hypothetical protein